MLSYELTDDGASITCKMCSAKSYNRGDIDNRYCHRCGVFHDDVLTPSCIHCAEPVIKGELVSPVQGNGQPMHYECGLRLGVGSVAHQMRRCTCYMPDALAMPHEDPAHTLRQDAQAAAARWVLDHADTFDTADWVRLTSELDKWGVKPQPLNFDFKAVLARELEKRRLRKKEPPHEGGG